MTTEQDPLAPHEPEIEFLGRVVRVGLGVVRVVLWVAGAAAIGWGSWQSFEQGELAFYAPYSAVTKPSAVGTVWIAAGLLLACPARWLFERPRARVALILGSALLWFGPMLLPDDSPYGFILRMFATLCAFLTIFVWRSLWKLTRR